MADSVFHRAMRTHGGRIAGMRVNALSAWHLMQLEAFGNRFVAGGALRVDDAVQVLLICRDRFRAGATNPLASAMTFCRSPWRRMAVAVWILCRRQTVFARIGEYVSVSLETPSYWSDDNSKQSRVPAGMLVAVRVMPLVGEDRAWNMPFGLACAYKAALDERDGAQLADADIAAAEAASEGNGNG
jgi:hypothetical protein